MEEPPPGEIIIVEAKGGSCPMGSRKIGNEAYQQGSSKYAEEITKLMSENEDETTEKIAAKKIRDASDIKLGIAEFKID
ncbi:hypothetical protein NI392_15810 [Vibrio alginolyticus]|nr:hypothetical protein [Vibrio alginolyticus]WMN46706.1 hypothetical protein NI392_15810 [Vibrio alginolyticus]